MKFRLHKGALMTASAAILLAASAAHASFEGFGNGIELESAARQIVPEEYTVDFGEGVDPATPVSWSSAPDWQSALRSAVSREGLSAQIGSNTVVISKAPEARPAPAAQTQRPAASPRPYSSSPSQPQTAQAPRVRQPAPRAAAPAPRAEYQGGGGFLIRPHQQSSAPSGDRLSGKGEFAPYQGQGGAQSGPFTVSEGRMLHPTLAGWAEAAGWRLVWDSAYDYRIDASASFGGSFIDAVTALSEAMSEARPRITVEFFTGNSVVVISNKSSDEVN